MKVGDLVMYNHAPRGHTNYIHRVKLGMPVDQVGVVLAVNEPCGTLKILTADKGIRWFVTICCEIVNESR